MESHGITYSTKKKTKEQANKNYNVFTFIHANVLMDISDLSELNIHRSILIYY